MGLPAFPACIGERYPSEVRDLKGTMGPAAAGGAPPTHARTLTYIRTHDRGGRVGAHLSHLNLSSITCLHASLVTKKMAAAGAVVARAPARPRYRSARPLGPRRVCRACGAAGAGACVCWGGQEWWCGGGWLGQAGQSGACVRGGGARQAGPGTARCTCVHVCTMHSVPHTHLDVPRAVGLEQGAHARSRLLPLVQPRHLSGHLRDRAGGTQCSVRWVCACCAARAGLKGSVEAHASHVQHSRALRQG